MLQKPLSSLAGRLRTQPARTGVTSIQIAIFFVVAMLAAGSATADDMRLPDSGPDETDLLYFFQCSEAARVQLLNFDEVKSCTLAYTTIKLSFVPCVGLDDFDRLSPREKAAVNLLGYRRYLEWRLQNAGQVGAATTAPLSPSVLAED